MTDRAAGRRPGAFLASALLLTLLFGPLVAPATARAEPPRTGSSPPPGPPPERERALTRPAAAKNSVGSKGPGVLRTTESEEGIKAYEFGEVQVEGRLKSPQVAYFLRRVRAEFASGLLGHRSFLRELADTRRHPALR